MHIPLDQHSSLPLYRQIEAFLRQGIGSGHIAVGTRLPASRRLAQDLGVSRISIDKAYGELLADGLLESRGSGGTIVLGPLPLPATERAAWQDRALNRQSPTARTTLARGAETARPAAAADPFEASDVPYQIDLAGGLGDPALFNLADFNRVLNTVRLRDGLAALDYGDPQGYAPLRRIISTILASQGLMVDPAQILVTAGSQQAITLVLSCLLRPGDVILVERPTYNTLLDLCRSLGLQVVDLPMDREGIDSRALETAIATYGPRLLYTMPTFHNPTGISASLERRRQVLAIAARHDLPILEDDYVGDLRYEGRALPSLKALDRQGQVIYVSTFSKMLLPGLRTGYLVLEGPVFDLLYERKRLTDLACNTLIQRTLAEFIGLGRYQNHLKRSIRLYRQRRDALIAALAPHADTWQWASPAGGMFLWLQRPGLPPGTSLATWASERGVLAATGEAFFSDPAAGSQFVRLNFAAHDPATLCTAVARLGGCPHNKFLKNPIF